MFAPHLDRRIGTKEQESVPSRNGYGDGLVEAALRDERVVALSADLTESTRTLPFAEKFPRRFVQVGITEQNMASVASGMAAMGKVPFIASYAMFSPGRNWEQIRTTVAYNESNVKIIGAHAGVSVGPDGATHQAIEDLALMRVMPNMIVIAPAEPFTPATSSTTPKTDVLDLDNIYQSPMSGKEYEQLKNYYGKYFGERVYSSSFFGYSVMFPTAFVIQLEGGGNNPYANDDIELVGHPISNRRYALLELKVLQNPLKLTSAVIEEAHIVSEEQREYGTLYISATTDREHDSEYSFRTTNIVWGDDTDLGQMVLTLKTKFDQNDTSDYEADVQHHEYLKNVVLSSFTVSLPQFYEVVDAERSE